MSDNLALKLEQWLTAHGTSDKEGTISFWYYGGKTIMLDGHYTACQLRLLADAVDAVLGEEEP
mgnify:CR=1 FL=1